MLVTLNTFLTNRTNLAKDVELLTLTPEAGSSFQFTPGQYVILHIPQPGGEPARRLYSIASSSHNKDSFELLIKYIPNGVASEFLKKITSDIPIVCQGPAGIFTIHSLDRNIVFLATGTGYAPIRSMLDQLLIHTHFSHTISLYWGFQKYEDVYMLDELIKMAEHFPSFHFAICLSRESSLDHIPSQYRPFIKQGRVTHVWQQQTDTATINDPDYYVCGGRDIVEGLRQFLQEQGVLKERIHFEKF